MKKIFILLGAVLFGSSLFAANSGPVVNYKKPSDPTTKERQYLASFHDKMATCLRSDRPFSDCHKEIVNNCMNGFGKNRCLSMLDWTEPGDTSNQRDTAAFVK